MLNLVTFQPMSLDRGLRNLIQIVQFLVAPSNAVSHSPDIQYFILEPRGTSELASANLFHHPFANFNTNSPPPYLICLGFEFCVPRQPLERRRAHRFSEPVTISIGYLFPMLELYFRSTDITLNIATTNFIHIPHYHLLPLTLRIPQEFHCLLLQVSHKVSARYVLSMSGGTGPVKS